ncbi:ATP-binding protein [Arcobacter sp. LA11]|uniref:ATP-binding protein n=1 Tax=Arcobacter sp. LA11 TaxID=1898176 RepID=UPI0009343400|nr:ATP-binding protein [Arcobacter sp. LA11]
MKSLDTLEKILIPVILTGFVFIVSLYIGIDVFLGSQMDNDMKNFMVFYMMLLLITLVIIAVFVTNRFVKMPMIELTSFLDKIENDQYESFDKKFSNSDIDNFVIQVNKLIKYLGNKDKKTNSLIDTLKDSNKSLEEYQKAVDASAIISKFDKNGLITYINDKFIEISGYKEDELLGKEYNILKHNGMNIEFFDKLWERISNKNIWNGEIKNQKKDNQEYHISSIIVPILDSNDDILEYLSFSVDITEHIHSLQQAREAEASKSIFLATMSHEIRTPLNGILGFAKLLETGDIPKKEKGYVDIINSSAKSLLGIINDILDISKIESGKFELERRRFNPFKEFEPAIELFVAKASEKDIDILFYIDPKLPSAIIGDPLKIKQVLSNLIGNAIKFTPKNGDIAIRIELVHKSDSKVMVVFSIKDSGIGIPDEKQKTIFDPFSQADSSVTRQFGGTGLGLSISSNIISLMGSKIELDSKEDYGSEFYFELDLEYEKTKNLYPQIDTSSKIAIFCYEYDCTSQLGIVKKYLTNYSEPEVTDHPEQLNEYSLAIGRYEDLIKLDLEKIDIPLIYICDYEEKIIDSSKEHRVIKSPINQSKLYDAIVDILNPGLEEDLEVDFEAIEHSNVICLIAEDNPVNQHLMEAMLAQKGIKSKIAENGQIALDEIKSGAIYDIIFMDINMPVMNGVEATHAIIDYEEENNINHTPIVALTANAVAGDKEKFMSEGMDDYIPKPFEEYMLDAVLNKYIKIKNESEEKKEEVVEEEVSEDDEFVYSIEDTAKSLGLGLPIFKTILKTFISSIDKDLDTLKVCIDENDLDKIKGAAHKIKGAAGNLKINNVFEVTKDIELSAKENFEIDYIKKYKKLEKYIKEIKTIYEEQS